MNRGFNRGNGPGLLIPPWMGGGDPSNDAKVLTADTSQEGGAKLAVLPASAVTLISTQKIVGTSTASVTFSAIPGGYTHLRAIVAAQTLTGAVDTIALQFNGDTAANYNWQRFQGANASSSITAITASARINLAQMAGTADTSALGLVVVEIPLYAGTSFYKSVVAVGGNPSATAADLAASVFVGNWQNAAAVTSIRFFFPGSSGNFASGSTVSLYGLN